MTAALLILIAVLRIAATFRTFSATTDEASHVGAGLELYQVGTYTLQPLNPPLPRIIMAAVPFAAGMRVGESGQFHERVVKVFFNENKYEHNLVFSRLGNLFFVLLAGVALFLWTRLEAGPTAALLALLLFTTEPVVLGYSGLATHDGPGMAGVAVALLAFSCWLRTPDVRRALLLGVAYGFAIACKFSCIAYVPAGCAAIFAVRLVFAPPSRRRLLRGIPMMIPLVVVTAVVVLWGTYGFTVGTIADIAHLRGIPNPIASLASLDPNMLLPAPAFFDGLGCLLEIDRQGMLSYALGRLTNQGWWWYFPVAVGLKTTLTLLLLLVAGVLFTGGNRELRRAYVEGTLAAMAMILPALPSHLNIGMRYVLPIYIPIAFAAGASAFAILRSGTIRRRAVIIVLAAHLCISVAAHPDYFPYFNAIAGRDPGRYLVDSNLDWGQDLLRLRSAVRHLKVRHLRLLPPAFVDYRALGFPPTEAADEQVAQSGYVAVSEQYYRIWRPTRPGWDVLETTPYRRIGKSIRLYEIP